MANALDGTTGYTVWVCVDCYMVHCNGESEGMPDDCDPLSLLTDAVDVTAGMFHEEHVCHDEEGLTASERDDDCECDEQCFSWSSCEGCGSSLGGSRHALTAWYRDR